MCLERITLGAQWAVKQEEISALTTNDIAYICLLQSFSFLPDFLALYLYIYIYNFFSLAKHTTKEKSCWPMLAFSQFAVPYNYSRSVSWQIQWPGLSPWPRAVLTDRWASQLMPSLVFVELWNVCCRWTRLSPAFFVARARLSSPSLGDALSIESCSKWSDSLSAKSISFCFHRLLVYILRAVAFSSMSQWGEKSR